MSSTPAIPRSQIERYGSFYSPLRRASAILRFDVRYRCRRTHEVLAALGVSLRGARVLDVGFGGGELLASFPRDCHVVGAEIAASAVECARRDPRFGEFASARFAQVSEDRPDDLPEGPFDVVVSAHTLEHVPDDRASLAAMVSRLRRGGVLVVFVPVEEADYIRFHLRTYSLQTIHERVRGCGLEVLHVEGSMHVNGHVWKLLTIPSRRAWPVLGPAADALRLATLSMLPYRAVRVADAALDRLGVGVRQALVVARKR